MKKLQEIIFLLAFVGGAIASGIIIFKAKEGGLTEQFRTEAGLAMAICLAGLVGLVFFGVISSFTNLFQTWIKKYIDNKAGSDWLEKLVDNYISSPEGMKAIVDNSVIVRKIVKKLEIDRNDDKEEEELPHETDFDTVIVPAGRSLEWNIKNNLYFCQLGRYFQDVNFLALYAKKEIQFYAHIGQRLTQKDLDKNYAYLKSDEFLKDYGVELDVKKYDFYKLDIKNLPNNGELSIKHEKPFALVQRQIYTSSESLKTAKTTDDIKRQNISRE